MSQISSDISGMLTVCKLMISCTDCKQVGSKELSCNHLVCEGCLITHPCIASKSASARREMTSPSLTFLRDLYEQLTMISSMNQIGNNNAAKIDKGKIQKRTRQQSPKKSPSPAGPGNEGVIDKSPPKQPFKPLPASEGVSITFRMEDEIDAYVKRYRPTGNENAFDQEASNDMPKLERQDKYKRKINLQSSSGLTYRQNGTIHNGTRKTSVDVVSISDDDHSDSDSIVDTIIKKEFDIQNEIKCEIKTENIDLDDSSNIPFDSSSDSVSTIDPMDNYGASTSSSRIYLGQSDFVEFDPLPGPSNISRQERQIENSSIRSESFDLRQNVLKKRRSCQKNRDDDEIDFVGFRENYVFKSYFSKFLYDSYVNKCSSSSRTYEGYEVIFKKQTLPLESQDDSASVVEAVREADSLLTVPPSNRLTTVVDNNVPENSVTDTDSVIDIDQPCHSRSSSRNLSQFATVERQNNGYHTFRALISPPDLQTSEEASYGEGPSIVSLSRKKKKSLKEDLTGNTPSENDTGTCKTTNMNGEEHIDGLRKDDINERLDGQIFIKKTNIIEANYQRPIALATCKLSSSENLAVIKLAKATNSQLKSSFSHETTHLILSQQNKENSIGSQEYLLAIVHGAFIVNFDWVQECLRESKIMSPFGFIPKTEEGPCRCLEIINKPFSGIYIFIGMSPKPSHLDYDPSYQVTKTLIYNGGAHIVVDLDKFLPYVNKETINPRLYICNADAGLPERIKGICEKLKALPIKASWVIDSIKQYRPLPINDYLCFPKPSKLLCDFYKVPSFLLKD